MSLPRPPHLLRRFRTGRLPVVGQHLHGVGVGDEVDVGRRRVRVLALLLVTANGRPVPPVATGSGPALGRREQEADVGAHAPSAGRPEPGAADQEDALALAEVLPRRVVALAVEAGSK